MHDPARSLDRAPRRILLTKLKQIGDVLLATPAIAALRNQFPGAKIRALVPVAAAPALAGNPHLDGLLLFERGAIARLRLVWALRAFRPDLVVELGMTRRERLLGVASGARCRAGFGSAGTTFGLTHAVAFDWGVHVVVNSARLLQALGVCAPLGPLHLAVSPEDLATVRSRLAEHGVLPGQPLAVVHPVTRWLFKSARDETMAGVVDGLRDRFGLRVVVTAGLEPAELARARWVVAAVQGPVLDLTGALTFGELTALLASAALAVMVDGAPMHIAAALQVPQVVLFGPTSETNWAPWQAPHALAAAAFPCRPCGQDGCHGSKVSDCLYALSAEEILEAVRRLLLERRGVLVGGVAGLAS